MQIFRKTISSMAHLKAKPRTSRVNSIATATRRTSHTIQIRGRAKQRTSSIRQFFARNVDATCMSPKNAAPQDIW
jgi:hypothetical protein